MTAALGAANKAVMNDVPAPMPISHDGRVSQCVPATSISVSGTLGVTLRARQLEDGIRSPMRSPSSCRDFDACNDRYLGRSPQGSEERPI